MNYRVIVIDMLLTPGLYGSTGKHLACVILNDVYVISGIIVNDAVGLGWHVQLYLCHLVSQGQAEAAPAERDFALF